MALQKRGPTPVNCVKRTLTLIASVILSFSAIATELSQSKNVGPTPQALKYAINGYEWALKHGQVNNPSILTVVDFTLPSSQKRMWVINLKSDKILMAMHVSQGADTSRTQAKHFSNRPGSHESSPGIYTTSAKKYNGQHGESVRMIGLENGINSNAEQRAIVIHPAWYVSPAFIKAHGYAGRSWGCFAVNPMRVNAFLNLIKGGSVLFAYAKPETHDSLVNHALSNVGEKLYDAILHKNA